MLTRIFQSPTQAIASSKPSITHQPSSLSDPFYYRQVTDPREYSNYIAQYAKASGNELPKEYLTKTLVFLFYKGDMPVAGFILNTIEQNPLRYFSYLSEDVHQSLLLEEDLSDTDFLEITSNWKSGELSASENHNYYSVMLKQAYRHAQLSGKKLLLGGSVIKPIKKLQQRLMDRVIYHGPIDPACQQMVKERQPLLKIYLVPVSQVLWRAALILWQRNLSRILRTIFQKGTTRAGLTS